jgi:DNA-binding CsgD family transcriptional regulator
VALAKQDIQQALDLVGEAHGAADLDELRTFIPMRLREILPSDYASYNELRDSSRVLAAIAIPEIPPQMRALWERYAHQNPLVLRFARTRDGRAYRFSDVATRAELDRLELFREFYSPLGVRHQIAFTLPSPPQLTVAIALARGDADYTERDRDLLNLLRPHLIQAYRNVQERTLAAPQGSPAGGPMRPETLVGLGLTGREAELLVLLAEGAGTQQIAAQMGIAPRTVYKHTERIHAKLGTRDRAHAVATALAAERAARAATDT